MMFGRSALEPATNARSHLLIDEVEKFLSRMVGGSAQVQHHARENAQCVKLADMSGERKASVREDWA